MDISIMIPHNIKIEIPYDPAIYQKKTKAPIRKHTCTPTFTAALFTIAKIWKQLKCPPVEE